MDKKELDALLARVAAGDNRAFERLYAETAKGVFAFAYSYLGNRADAEDVMQSAYLQIKQKAHTYRAGTNARAWMFQIVKNMALDELRRRKRRAAAAERERTSSSVAANEGNVALEYMMRTLSAEEREVVLLHVFWGYKHREIADLLGVPLGTVTWRYNIAIRKLRDFEAEV